MHCFFLLSMSDVMLNNIIDGFIKHLFKKLADQRWDPNYSKAQPERTVSGDYRMCKKDSHRRRRNSYHRACHIKCVALHNSRRGNRDSEHPPFRAERRERLRVFNILRKPDIGLQRSTGYTSWSEAQLASSYMTGPPILMDMVPVHHRHNVASYVNVTSPHFSMCSEIWQTIYLKVLWKCSQPSFHTS